MLSGIGPSEELNEHHIPVVVDAPGVGENLVDHPVIDLYYKNRFADSPRHVNPSTIPQVFQLVSSVVQYLASGTGALTTNVSATLSHLLRLRVHETESSSGVKQPPLSVATTRSSFQEANFRRDCITRRRPRIVPTLKSSPRLWRIRNMGNGISPCIPLGYMRFY
jgi:choline dehydrogenase-like flavoprotein